MAVAVIDIDGVVADVRHRLHHLHGGSASRRSWPAFFAAANADPVLEQGVALVADLAASAEIVWLTGRPAWLRATTREWLSAAGLPADELHMRPEGDRRPARVFKLGVLRHLRERGVVAFVDDDPDVVEAALRAGFPAVLADWVPRGDGTGQTDVLREAQERFGRT